MIYTAEEDYICERIIPVDGGRNSWFLRRLYLEVL
jgi:hypothetical protein